MITKDVKKRPRLFEFNIKFSRAHAKMIKRKLNVGSSHDKLFTSKKANSWRCSAFAVKTQNMTDGWPRCKDKPHAYVGTLYG